MTFQVPDITITLPTNFTTGGVINPTDIKELRVERMIPGGGSFLLLDNSRSPTALILNLINDYGGSLLAGVHEVRVLVRMTVNAGGKESAFSIPFSVTMVNVPDDIPNAPTLS